MDIFFPFFFIETKNWEFVEEGILYNFSNERTVYSADAA